MNFLLPRSALGFLLDHSIDISPKSLQTFHGIHGITIFSDSLGRKVHHEINFFLSCPDVEREQDLDFWIHCHS